MEEMDIESSGEIIISRKFSETGKNTIKLNGNTVTASMLRKVTDSIVDVHGQSEHFFLLNEANQLKTLDSVIGERIVELKDELRGLLSEKKAIDKQIDMIGGDEQERNRRLDLLNYQIEEIKAVNLQEGEEEELKEFRMKVLNQEKIIDSVKRATSFFENDGLV